MHDLTRHPVLLLHGTNGAAWTMENAHRVFDEAGFTCHSLTYRAHDLPPGPDRDAQMIGLSIADYLDDARQAIDSDAPKPIVVGHSLGAVLAQLLAAEDRIAAGVLINSSIVNGMLPTTDLERDLGKMFMSAGAFWNKAMGQDFELLAQFGLNTLPEPLQHQIHERLDTESGRVLFEFMFWMYDVNQTTLVEPDAVSCPLLFLSGTKDRAVSTSTARAMAARYASADFRAVEGACHYMQYDSQWPQVAQDVLGWLSERL
ncbi:MAG: alpha/beta hydrolase [Marinibacterium sp.]|nr:alpha/beta hydrolase [Marinibacterium sp.]